MSSSSSPSLYHQHHYYTINITTPSSLSYHCHGTEKETEAQSNHTCNSKSLCQQVGCFHLVATVTKAPVKISIQASVWVPAFNSFEYISSSGIAGSYGSSMFNLEELPNCFPQQLHHFTFPPAVHKGSTFSTSSPALAIFCFILFCL